MATPLTVAAYAPAALAGFVGSASPAELSPITSPFGLVTQIARIGDAPAMGGVGSFAFPVAAGAAVALPRLW